MEKTYKPISEVADELKIPSHVIRFWETKFSIISPVKRSGGRRFYEDDDILILKKIKDLLYNHSYSIKSVQQSIDTGYFAELVKQTAKSIEPEKIFSSKKIETEIPKNNTAKIIANLEEIKTILANLV